MEYVYVFYIALGALVWEGEVLHGEVGGEVHRYPCYPHFIQQKTSWYV